MQQVGVEAVVEGLQSFLGDMKQVNGALNGLRPAGTLLQQMFENVGNAVVGFGASVQRVVETALGVMLRDAVEGAIRLFGDLLDSIIKTGVEFQTLKIRLTGMNLNETSDGIKSYTQAMAEAQAMTAKEVEWLQTLGAATPFDPATIADTYTMARAFGFASDAAQRLTKDIIEYVAGQGLSNDVMFLVIQNMGQMIQRGKITGTEIKDLARGSYLPLADVLALVAKNMGMTVAELTKKISTPEGIPAQEFVKAFEEMVEKTPRFIGAAGRLARAFIPASQNVKELVTSIFGLNVVTPILDILGEAIAGIVDEFAFFNEQGDLVKTEKWDRLVAAATNLGVAISDVIKQLLTFLPTTANFTDTLINGIQSVAVWIRENQGNIVNFFLGIANAINTYVIIPFQRISAWVVENWPMITAFFGALGDIINQVFGDLLGGKFASGDFLGGLLDAVKTFMQYVIDNKKEIALWVEAFIRVVAIIEIVLTVFNVFIGVLGAVVGFVVGLIGGILSLIAVLTFLVSPIALITVGLLGIGAAMVAVVAWVYTRFGEITAIVQKFFDTFTGLYKYFQTQLSNEPDFMNDWLTMIPPHMQGVVAQVGAGLQVLQERWSVGASAINANMSNLVHSLDGQFAEIRLLFTNTPAAMQILIKGFESLPPAAENVFRMLRTGFSFLIQDISKMPWFQMGSNIISGIANGVSSNIGRLINAVMSAVQRAYQAALNFLGIQSPSKLFEEMGGLTMEGFSQGIQRYANVAASTMTNAMRSVAMPAFAMPSIIQSVMAPGGGGSVSTTNTSNYNLTVNSAASAEPIVQDFSMLQSLSGG